MTWATESPDFGQVFGLDFQGALLIELLSGGQFSSSLAEHVDPGYFQNEAHAWAWSWARDYRGRYGASPSLAAVVDAASRIGGGRSEIYVEALLRAQGHEQDRGWVRDRALDFVRRQLFRRAFIDSRDLFNVGRVDDAYQTMSEAMSRLASVSWAKKDRQWLAEEFADRHVARQDGSRTRVLTGTGVPVLDQTLGGGVGPGFLGVWLARPKAGKTTFLCNLGAVALRVYGRKVLHVTLEGSGAYIADRYDTIFTDELYASLRRGEVDADRYAAAYREMTMLRGNCVIRAFTDEWEYNITHVWDEIRELEQAHGWRPDLIILDYCDLLDGRPRPGGYRSTTEAQKASFQDLKSLANRGYAIWTASQVQRPRDKDFDEQEDLLKSRDIADCYAKVRIADMVGSINQTRAERESGVMRLYVELMRDAASDVTMLVDADFSRMKIGGGRVVGRETAPKSLGYGRVQSSWVQAQGER